MIPEQLKDQLFCRIEKGSKKPFEMDWTKKPYTYKQIQKYFPAENYGVLTGINNLAVLDDDTPNKILMKLFVENFGETFRVRDHYYFYIEGLDKKLIFYDKEGKHCGELQWKGQQVVGAGSTHPSGAIYELKSNIPIITIQADIFMSVFIDYLIEKNEIIREFVKTDFEGDRIQEIPLTNIISLSGLRDMGRGCYQGPHIVHGSTGGMNFRVNTNQNNWYCFRCSSGGGPAELIAVVEGIISCHQAGPRCFTESQAQEVIRIAREKYGLRTPEIKQPKGWACSINIKRMAERYNLLNCPKCNTPFLLNETTGCYKCLNCGDFGTLKTFANLILIKSWRLKNGNTS